ncbi:hypothetical protein [Alcaligenes phenolicus]
MTAFGTVGAVMFSLVTALSLGLRQKSRQKRRAALKVASLGPVVSDFLSISWYKWARNAEATEDALSQINYLKKDILATIHPTSDEFDPALNELLFKAYEAFERACIYADSDFKNETWLGFSLLREAWNVTKEARKAVGHRWIDRRLDLQRRPW